MLRFAAREDYRVLARKLAQVGGVIASLLLAPPALAKGDGISGFSGKSSSTCSSCHGSTPVSTIVISGPSTLAPGATGSFTLTITRASSTRTSAGLDVAASGGTLVKDAAEAQTALSSGEIVQTAPKIGGAAVTFGFRWTAPSVAGGYTLYAAGIRGDGKSSSGDETGHTTLAIKVAAAAAPDAAVALPDAKVAPLPDAKVAPLPDAKVAPLPDAKAGGKPDAKVAPKPDLTTAPLPDAASAKLDGAAKLPDAKPALSDAKGPQAEAKIAATDRGTTGDGAPAAGDGAAVAEGLAVSPDAGPPSSPPSSSSGGCSFAGEPQGGAWLLLVLGFALLLAAPRLAYNHRRLAAGATRCSRSAPGSSERRSSARCPRWPSSTGR